VIVGVLQQLARALEDHACDRRLPKSGGSGLSAAQWAYFLDRPWSAAELKAAGESRWSNYRLTTDSSTFGSLHDDGTGYARRLWAEYESDVLAVWTDDYPGTRPSQWWRFSAPQDAQPGAAAWEVLERLNEWLPGERERAVEMFGRLRPGRETCQVPQHSDFDRRGRYRPRRDRLPLTRSLPCTLTVSP
jgi:hypothetical protein